MRTPRWQTLLALAVLLLPPAAWGSPSLTITGPAAGNLTDTRPTFTITYSSDNPNLPLNLSTFSVTANGVAWTGRFTAAPDGATYIVPQGEPLVAGPLVLTASIRDTAGTQASDGRTYAVVPTFVAMLPTTGEPGDTLTLTVRGLSATPTDNSAVFASLSGSPIVVPFASADVPADMGSVLVPEDAASGDVFVRIAGGTAQTDTPQTIAFTRRGLGPTCGTGTRQLQYLPNGDFIVYYGSYHSWNLVDPRCPPEANQATKAIRHRRDLDWAFTLAESTYENGRYIDVVGLTSDSYGNPAVLLHSWNTPGTNITRLKYNNRLHEFVPQVYDLFAASNYQHVPIAFDPSGNLYLLGRRESPGGIRLYKVPKQQLTSIGSLQPVAITGDLSLDALDEPADIAMSCDGTAFVGLRSSCLAGSNWTRVRHLDLATGAELGTLNEPGLGCLRDLDLTCRTNELLGASFSTSDTTVRTRFWRALVDPDGGLGVPTTISENTSSPDHPLGYLSVTPAGRIATPHENPATYGGGPYSGLVYIQPTVAPCQFVSAPPTAQGLSCPLCELTVLPTTDRWKPQRSNEKITIRFEGPRDLATGPEYPATLEITPWGTQAPLTGVIRAGTAPCEPTDLRCQYEVDWDGGWVQGNERLPAGNYSVVVKAKAGTALRDVQSQAYHKVSLVEVKSVEILTSPGTDTYPEVEANTIPGTGGGLNAYIDAKDAGGAYRNTVTVRVRTEPPLHGAVTDVLVSLRRIDVDDPYAPPQHVTGAARHVVDDDSGATPSLVDNRGDPLTGGLLYEPVTSSDEVEFEVPVSTVQGDNHRFAASTHTAWLFDAVSKVPSDIGEVRHADDPGHAMPEGQQITKMLTIWRTLHVEVVTFDAATVPGQNSLDAPTASWTQLSAQTLTDSTIDFTSVTPNPVTNRRKSNLWRGANVSPHNDGVVFPVSGNGPTNLDTNGGDMCTAVPPTYCSSPPVDPKYREYFLRDDELDASLTVACDPTSGCYCGGPGAHCTTGQLLTWVLEPVLSTAHIRLEATETAIPFIRALDLDSQRQMRPALSSSYTWWNMLVPFAFDPGWQNDHDPTLERTWENGVMLKGSGWSGITVAYVPVPPPLPPGTSLAGDQVVAATFREAIRDFYDTGDSCMPHPTVLRAEMVASNVAHEVLHGLRLYHTGDSSGGLLCSAFKNNTGEAHRLEITELQRAHLRGAPAADGFVLRKPFISTGVYYEVVSGCELEIQGGC